MGRRLVVVILIAAMIAGGVFYFARMVQRANPPMQQQATSNPVQSAPAARTSQILVAAKDLPSGTIIQANSLVFRAWPDDAIDQQSYVLQGSGTLEEFDGAVARSGMRSGEPVIRTNLIKRGESGFMAAVLRPGMRAVSLAVNENTGVAGFVFPGDNVDLVLSHVVNLGDANGQMRPHNVSETVLHDIRVIGIDQRSGDQEQAPAVGNVVTLEVTPEQAERISLAQRMGELRLILRPLAKSADDASKDGSSGTSLVMPVVSDADQRTFTLDSDLSQIIAAPGGTGAAGSDTVTSVQVVRGTTSADAQVK